MDTAAFLLRRRSFVHMSLAAALAAFAGYSVATFFPTFLSRTHGLDSLQIGLWLGLILGIAGGAGIFVGGFCADRFGARDPRWKLWTIVLATVASLPFAVAVYLLDRVEFALLVFVVPAFLSNFYQATTFAQTQSLVNLRMRGVAAAVLLLVINLVGLGLGPWLTGTVSDWLEPRYGEDNMRYALLMLNVVVAWSAWHYYRAGVHLPGDLARADDAR